MGPTSQQTINKTSSSVTKKTNRVVVAPKPVLSKPAALKTNSSIENRAKPISEINYSSFFDSISRDLEKVGDSMDERFEQLVKKMDDLIIVKVEIGIIKESNEKNYAEIINRLDQLEAKFERCGQPQTSTNNFSPEMITKARDSLGLDLTQELVYQGRDLVNAVPFNKSNINLYGTKLLSILFSKEELSEGSVEPLKNKKTALDQDRIDLLKICYLRKLKTIDLFSENWTSIVRSLRQKCLDAKRDSKGPAENGNEAEGDYEENHEQDGDQDNMDEQSRSLMSTNISMQQIHNND